MIKSSDIILAGLMIITAVWTFQVKYQTKDTEAGVVQLEREISKENDRVRLLEADWAVLTQPSRLQELSERFSRELNLKSPDISQIATPEHLPPLRILDDPIGAIARQQGDVDATITGSVGGQNQ